MGTLTVLRDTNLLNIPATLRNIADSVEAGEYGSVSGCVVVLDTEALDVFYTGTGEAGPNAHLLLHAGAAKMLKMVVDSKLPST